MSMSEMESQLEKRNEPALKECLVAGQGSGSAVTVFERFLETKAYQLFVDVCEYSRHTRTIGICSGVTGVGKTQAARRFCQWDVIEPRLARHAMSQDGLNETEVVPRTAFYTPEVTATPKRTEQDVALLRWEIQQMADAAVAREMGKDEEELPTSGYIRPGQVDLLIVDEANRLCPVSLEMLRDVFDRGQMGLVLVGRPGLEKKVRSIAPLASRVGMRLEFAGLSVQELDALLQRYIQGAGVEIDAEVASALLQRTKGNFRSLRQVLLQIEYLLRINQRRRVTMKLVDVACAQLLW